MSYVSEHFHNWLPPHVERYNNGRIAVEYWTVEEGYPEPAVTATINLIDEHIGSDEVIIKNYSENEGLYKAMLDAGHIGPELRRVSSGFITAPVCKWLYNAAK